jgi:hypothetical protein
MRLLFTEKISTLDGDHVIKLCEVMRTQGWKLNQAETEAAVKIVIERKKGIPAIESIREVGKLITNYQTDLGWSWLHLAAQTGDIEMLDYFLGWGIDLNLTNGNGWTALDVAENLNYEEAVTFLREQGGVTGIEIPGDSSSEDA